MGKRRILLFCLFLSVCCAAHPGIGLVKDSKGNIYYTDLKQVWRIAPDGKKTIVVQGVHTHELYMDEKENLYGQQSTYSGEATNKWYHYIWRLNTKGKLDTIIPLTEGFYIEDFSFIWDKKGNRYWIQHWKEDRLMKTACNGKTTVIATGDFKLVQWMHILNDVLYFIRYDTVFKVENGITKVVAADLCSKEKAHNSLFALWSDARNNLYVANFCKRKIQQITPAGAIKDYYQSPKGWSPSSGLFDNSGNFWVMEYDSKNEVRVRKVKDTAIGNKQGKQKATETYLLLPVGIGLIMILIIRLWKEVVKHERHLF